VRRSVRNDNEPDYTRQVRRAAFLPDDEEMPVYSNHPDQPEQDSDWFAVSPPAAKQDDPWETPFAAQPQEWFYQEQAQPAPVETSPYADLSKRRWYVWAVTACASLLLILFCIYSIYAAYQNYPQFNQKARVMGKGTFFDGIVMDDIPVGGMSRDQVFTMVSQMAEESNPQLNIRIQIDDIAYAITNREIPFKRNYSTVLEEAWSIGRQNFHWGLGSSLTPFEIRWQHTRQTSRDKAYFQTRVSYDQAAVASLAQSICRQLNREPVSAVIQEFNFSTKEFKVSQDVQGRQMSENDISNALTQALDSGRYDTSLILHSTPVLPAVSSIELKNSFTQLASFSTKTTSNEDRNNNIALAAHSISGRTLMPGQVFSFNETTGQRTIEKGYRGAPAILGGVLIDDVGGGVCQVSSTLFNTAALAGMTIIDRSPHAWPVSYLEKGFDAAVNWPNLDFKFRNDKNTPVFLIAYYTKRTLTIEIYGMLGAPGENIRLETQLISTTQPPSEPLMQPNPSLPPNTTKELKQARPGYVVDTYRIFLRNGSEYRREKLFSSKYNMVQQVIEYN